jgi:DNA-binding CsgD family transcriptional regulator
MQEGYQSLTDKEKETLRLLVRGYDTKTIARHFALSVHTVNERLRNARRKMTVSSSREAARLLSDTEAADPHFLAGKLLGEAGAAQDLIPISVPNDGEGTDGEDTDGEDTDGKVTRAFLVPIIGGIIIMSLLLAALALTSVSQNAGPAASAALSVTAVETAAPQGTASAEEQSARAWLSLVDDFKWAESWNATGKAFKDLNTQEQWASVAGKVQPQLGALQSRTIKSQEFVPAPPYGYEMVRFQSSFANRPSVIETVTLSRENDTWKVVGYWLD